MYRILETELFVQDLETQLGSHSAKLISKLRDFVYPSLKQNPYYGPNIKKLKNYQLDTWRYRIGDYRFFYEVNLKEKVIIMMAADHRKDCY